MTAATPSAPGGVTGWQLATVRTVDHPTQGFVRLRLELPEPAPHRAGQHYVVRLRAEDGYTAQRSYSTASAPGDPLVELMVERMDDGEVSGFLHDDVRVGDTFEVRGPIGRWFTWDGSTPALAFAGGSGVVPMVSMLRHAIGTGAADSLRVVVVAKSLAVLPYADELRASGAFVALTRENLGARVAAPPYPDEVAPLLDGVEAAYVCGSVGFVGYATRLLQEQAFPADAIRVEQFGETG
ncbi:FAD-binding oxidoreductase [Aeromicrobium sp. 50.2.37]|uniref:FAD-binding oxidoreductase n=1 Tax=Aeromicrobium sp. 50.2.37 TaxID=2969305 RepID=UPI00214FBEF9|nr:FAD-binding oxidoreductase [Aeromicrobium sp. 50.2.37]MCR4513563.1 FAD-binding oxidoreductase [Aeromicrobium sp. 50.2.37]